MQRDARLVMDARGCMSAVDGLTQVILPVYLSILGFSGLQLSFLFAAVTCSDALLSTLVGLFSDRIGRKPFMVGMPLLTAAAGFVFATTRHRALPFVFATLGPFGWGTDAVADASGPYAPAEQAWMAGVAAATGFPRRLIVTNWSIEPVFRPDAHAINRLPRLVRRVRHSRYLLPAHSASRGK